MKSKILIAKLNNINRRFNRLQNDVEKELRPLIKQKALACKQDMINTQWSLSTRGKSQGKEGKRFDELSDFLAKIEGSFKIAFYFEVHEGKFYWL